MPHMILRGIPTAGYGWVWERDTSSSDAIQTEADDRNRGTSEPRTLVLFSACEQSSL